MSSTAASRAICLGAALMGAAGVALGAMGAHLPNASNLSVASSFLLFHAPALLALEAANGRSRLRTAGELAMLVGSILFSGALALDSLTTVKISPSPAPFGGVLLIFGWLLVGASFLVRRGKPGA
ncbi:MAG: DUF423 domain-containing protein [Rhizobiales bacterium]|nr:DUF423 domain-containing protein [Hyphomicrobiales bacterium]MDQ3560069.1 DUF423 domain-containing protein [Pseudomonadota bacterium]